MPRHAYTTVRLHDHESKGTRSHRAVARVDRAHARHLSNR